MILELKNVKYQWQGDRRYIIDIQQLSVARQLNTFIMGPSGCGKSTLLNLISGVITPAEGTIHLSDTNLTKMNSSKRDKIRADNVGYIFQQFNLIPYLNSMENVLLSCLFSSQRERNSIEQGGSVEQQALKLLNGFFNDNPPDLYKPISTLSVGQQQRVAAARALIGKPALVIADEPTSALDQDTKQNFMSLLLTEVKNSQSTLLFVSHDPQLSVHFDDVIKLKDINRAQ